MNTMYRAAAPGQTLGWAPEMPFYTRVTSTKRKAAVCVEPKNWFCFLIFCLKTLNGQHLKINLLMLLHPKPKKKSHVPPPRPRKNQGPQAVIPLGKYRGCGDCSEADSIFGLV